MKTPRSMNLKPRDRRKRWLWVSALAVGCLLSGVGFVSWLGLEAQQSLFKSHVSHGIDSAETLEKLLGLTLPTHTTDIKFYSSGWLDDVVYTRFLIPQPDLEPFMAINRLKTVPIDMPQPHEDRPEWWHPENLGKPQMLRIVTPTDESGTSTMTKTGFYPTVMVGEAEKNYVMVYVFAFNT